MDGISKNSLPNAFYTSLDSGCEQTDVYFDDSDSGCETTDFYDELESSGYTEIDAMEHIAYQQNISTQIYPDTNSIMALVKLGRNKFVCTKPIIFKKRKSKQISMRSSASTVVHGEASPGSESFFSSFE